MIERGEFLESAEVHGNLYGTSQAGMQGVRESGHDVLLEIDWQGAQQVRRLFPDAIGIFILPPSLEELAAAPARARPGFRRGDPRSGSPARREEIAHVAEFDYVIINNDFEEARRDLAAVVRACRLRLATQIARHPEPFFRSVT